MGRAEIDRRTLRDDPSGVDSYMADAIVPLDLLEVDRLGDAWDLV